MLIGSARPTTLCLKKSLAITSARPKTWSPCRWVKKIVLTCSDLMPALSIRRMVPMPQSIRYGRPSTRSRVEGSDRSRRNGGPPAVPRKRISVRLFPPMGSPRPVATAAHGLVANINPATKIARPAVANAPMPGGSQRTGPVAIVWTEFGAGSRAARRLRRLRSEQVFEVGPEFGFEVEDFGAEQINANAAGGEAKAAVGFGVIEVGGGAGDDGARELGGIEDGLAGAVAAGDEDAGEGVEHARGDRALAEAEVARILVPPGGQEIVADEAGDVAVGEGGGVALAEAGPVLTVAAVAILAVVLEHQHFERAGRQPDGIVGVVDHFHELFVRAERRLVLIGDVVGRDHKEDVIGALARLLLRLLLL